ncbi:chloroplast Mg-chelatase subunit XANTHA-G precursor [Hordeum vulgare]|nr:chloroplast Mg-chelatase subunit XANTHA-G precursor [Hordeum vulgare]
MPTLPVPMASMATSLPHLPPRRLPSHPVDALSLAPPSFRRREAPARLAAVASGSKVLDSTNSAAPAPASLASSGAATLEGVFKMVEEETEVAKTEVLLNDRVTEIIN